MVPFSLDRLMQMKLFLLTLPTVIWYVVAQNEREKMEKAKNYKKDLETKMKEAEARLLAEENKSTVSTSKTTDVMLVKSKSSCSLRSGRKSAKNSARSNAYLDLEKDPNGKLFKLTML